MDSLWRNQTEDLEREWQISDCIRRKSHWDVIVVGAGLAGILTAYFLKEQGKSVLILEAGQIACGQTERTTAKITSQHGLKYSKLIKNVGKEKAKLYARANEEAIAEYERLVQTKDISCQFKKTQAFLYTCADKKKLQEEFEAAALLGIETVFTQEIELPFEIKAAVGFKNQAQFSPLEFIKGIVSELNILENSKVTEIKGNWVISNHGILTAENIVVTTHYPIKNIPGFYFLRQHQERSYVLALSECGKIENMYYGVDTGGLSFRQAGEFLLVGGEGHRTGKKSKCCNNIYEELYRKAKIYYSDCKVETQWSAQDCMPHDGIPFIGKYSIFTPNLYVATGFQKWGMTSSMIAGKLLSDVICGKDNPYQELFSPQRFHIRAGIGNLLIDMGENVKNIPIGIFQKKKCSHMNSRLEWNATEQSWDCPCHGSRFDENGRLLDNPAKDNMKGNFVR